MGAIQNEAGRFWPESGADAVTDKGLAIQGSRPLVSPRTPKAQASTFIQVIETRWNRQAQSVQQSAIRNAVPMILRAPAGAPQGAVLMHRAVCCESQGFAPSVSGQFEEFSADLASQYRLAVHAERHGVRVEFFGDADAPDAATATDSIVLSAGMWLRIVANRRVPDGEGWVCQRFVYNIAYCEPCMVNALLAGSAPVLSINRETQLG